MGKGIIFSHKNGEGTFVDFVGHSIIEISSLFEAFIDSQVAKNKEGIFADFCGHYVFENSSLFGERNHVI